MLSKSVTTSESSESSCFWHRASVNSPKIVTISFIVSSLVLVGLGLGIYFYGQHYFPQIFSTSTRQIIGIATCCGLAFALSIAAAIYNLCASKKHAPETRSEPPPEPTVKHVQFGEYKATTEDCTHMVLLAEGVQAYNAIDGVFLSHYQEEVKTKGIRKAFESALEQVHRKCTRHVGLICCYDSTTRTAYLAGIGKGLYKPKFQNRVSLAGDEMTIKPTLTIQLKEGETLTLTHDGKQISLP